MLEPQLPRGIRSGAEACDVGAAELIRRAIGVRAAGAGAQVCQRRHRRGFGTRERSRRRVDAEFRRGRSRSVLRRSGSCRTRGHSARRLRRCPSPVASVRTPRGRPPRRTRDEGEPRGTAWLRSDLEPERAQLGLERRDLAEHALGRRAACHGARGDGARGVERLERPSGIELRVDVGEIGRAEARAATARCPSARRTSLPCTSCAPFGTACRRAVELLGQVRQRRAPGRRRRRACARCRTRAPR